MKNKKTNLNYQRFNPVRAMGEFLASQLAVVLLKSMLDKLIAFILAMFL